MRLVKEQYEPPAIEEEVVLEVTSGACEQYSSYALSEDVKDEH